MWNVMSRFVRVFLLPGLSRVSCGVGELDRCAGGDWMTRSVTGFRKWKLRFAIMSGASEVCFGLNSGCGI